MLIMMRGAGDIASGIALRLYHAGFSVVMTDISKPTSIRRTVCFSEAIYNGTQLVEDVEGVLATSVAEIKAILAQGKIAVAVDPEAKLAQALQPVVLIDAILAKRNLGTTLSMAPFVIGVGPGFTAGIDCHAVVETMRGHTLGRVIRSGSALPNTNIPGLIGGFAGERVLRAPDDGVFCPLKEIGDTVQAGETVATVNGKPMTATISGTLRGLLRAGVTVTAKMKSGDVDPRGDAAYCRLVSDKALAVGGGVLEAVMGFLSENRDYSF